MQTYDHCSEDSVRSKRVATGSSVPGEPPRERVRNVRVFDSVS